MGTYFEISSILKPLTVMNTEDDNINRGGKVYPTGVHIFSKSVFAPFEINLLKVELSLCM